jgi:hypothetical protein
MKTILFPYCQSVPNKLSLLVFVVVFLAGAVVGISQQEGTCEPRGSLHLQRVGM